MPNVIAGLELRRKGLNRAAFGVARCSISDRGRKERGNGDGNESGVLHRCCYSLIQYAASALSSLWFISFCRKSNVNASASIIAQASLQDAEANMMRRR